MLLDTLKLRACIGIGKYLGLPSMIGRSKISFLYYIKERIWKHISSWSSRTLLQVGKEVFIKYDAQVIPSYCMSVFLLATSIEDEIQSMLNSF